MRHNSSIANAYVIAALERRVLLSGNMLVFTAMPKETSAGGTIDLPGGVQVTVENSAGQPIVSDTDSIAISLGSNPAAATLSGTLSVSAVNGVATFSDLSISLPRNGFTLVASDMTTPATTSVTSAVFNVDALPAFNSLFSFTHGADGDNAPNSLIGDNAGHLFGTTSSGGFYNYGTVFELSGPGYSTKTTLLSFTDTLGAYPGIDPDAIILDSTGNLYGTTAYGGLSPYGTSEGTVFELSGANHSTYTTVAEFTGTSGVTLGAQPSGNLTLDRSGDLFGTTYAGGTANDGTAYEISLSNHDAFLSLTSFTGTTGASPGENPCGAMVLDASGNLYGTTNSGGTANGGTVFELTAPKYSAADALYNFPFNQNGTGPEAGLATDSAGDLIGTTSADGGSDDGSVFELSGTLHGTYTVLASFTGTGVGSGAVPGAGPNDQLVADASGNLYGTTYGGAGGSGLIYELSGAAHTNFTPLIAFTGQSGLNPGTTPSTLTIDSSGNLFGATVAGGENLVGEVFELPAAHPSTITKLYTFNAGAGVSPQNETLARDSSGDLFGITPWGGTFNEGTVFELSGQNDSIYTTLISFSGNTGNDPGYIPVGTLTFDSTGDLFGVTEFGGANGDGTVYELSGSNHQSFRSLEQFGSQGNLPQAGVIFDGGGDLYGTTSEGGTYGDGTIYELSGVNFSTFASLISFSNTGAYPGARPLAPLTYDKNTGNLYGTTENGGAAGDGTVFQLSGGSHSFSSLVSFTGTAGSDLGKQPSAGIFVDGSGNLFGTTQTGGSSGFGNVFEVMGTNHTAFSSLLSFTGNTGTYPGLTPVAALAMDATGNLYGTTEFGGTNGSGTVFKLAAGTRAFTSLVALTGTLGSDPGGGIDGGVVSDSAGNLFGTTIGGGIYGLGTVFEIAVCGNTSLTASSGTVTVAPPLGVNSTRQYLSSLSVNAGATIVAPALSTSVLATTALTLAGASGNWTATLDLSRGSLDLSTGSLQTILNQINKGFNGAAGGNWQGMGITSGAAASDTLHLTALGYLQNNQSGVALFTNKNLFEGTVPGAGDLLIKYTYYGDANLDGKVDGSDYSRIDYGVLKHLTGWFNGDFNYDGVINGSDYTLIDNAYNTQGASLAAQVATAQTQIAVRRQTAVFSHWAINANEQDSMDAWMIHRKAIAAGIFGGQDQ